MSFDHTYSNECLTIKQLKLRNTCHTYVVLMYAMHAFRTFLGLFYATQKALFSTQHFPPVSF